METALYAGPPEPGSVREKELKSYCEQMRYKLQDVIDRRRSGQNKDRIPFIDALLQSGVSDQQVIELLYVSGKRLFFTDRC